MPVAYLDFKDTQFLYLTNVLQSLRLGLSTILPDFAKAESLDSWIFLKALYQLSGPALVLIDNYEEITETKDLAEWIETQFLVEVEKCKQLRALIGVRKVPDYTLNRWRGSAKEIELTKIDDKQVWLDWIRQN